jgi:hypothetical protein
MSDKITPLPFDPDFASVEDYARYYRSLGWQALPAHAPSTNPKVQWKRPTVDWKEHQTALVSDPQFDSWFAGYKGSNLGLATGECSGRTFVVDLDLYKNTGAIEWWHGLLLTHNNGMDFETVEQITGGGGRQLLFRYPPGWHAPNLATPIGVDIRGQGGFVVLPPSKHTSGDTYDWAEGYAPWEIPVADAPQWLLDAVDALSAKYGAGGSGKAAGGQGPVTSTPTPDRPRTFSGRLLDGRERYMTSLVWGAVLDVYEERPIRADGQMFEAERNEAFCRYRDHVASRLTDPDASTEDLLEREGRGRTLFSDKWAVAISHWDTTVRQAVEARKKQPDPFPVEIMDPETGEFSTIEISALIRADPAAHPDEDEFGGVPVAHKVDDIEYDEFGGVPVTHVTPPSLPPPPSSGMRLDPITNVWDPWERFPAPEFPLDTLPLAIRNYVITSARSTGGDVSACAMTALAVCAAAIDMSYRLKMKGGGTWEVPPILWVMLFGDPSSKKTPIIKQFMWALDLVEADARKAHAREVAQWAGNGGKKGDDDEPKKPVRYVSSDATVEKVAEILTRQDRGLLMHKDELSGWLAALDGSKNGREAEKSFWTKAYNGNSHSVDRIMRGETFISNLAVSIIGGMQPGEMAKIPDLTTNGLLQRFLPVVMRPSRLGEEIDDSKEAAEWERIVRYLTSLTPCRMQASDGAKRVFLQFQRDCLDLESVRALGEKFTTFVGKLPGMHGALSLILHLIDGGWDSRVSEDAAKRAAKVLWDFSVPHALAFYAVHGDTKDVELIRSTASFVLTAKKDRFTANDFAANSRAMRGIGMWEMTKRMSVFVVNGWLEEEYDKKGAVCAWVIRPGIREALQRRKDEQEAQRTRVAEMLAKLRNKPAKGS